MRGMNRPFLFQFVIFMLFGVGASFAVAVVVSLDWNLSYLEFFGVFILAISGWFSALLLCRRQIDAPEVGMKFQFSISAILLTTTFVAIALGARRALDIVMVHFLNRPKVGWSEWYWQSLRISSVIWVQFVFAAYAIGRRRVTVPLLIAFAIAEGVSLAYIYWVMPPI